METLVYTLPEGRQRLACWQTVTAALVCISTSRCLQQQWKTAAAELDPLVIRERERYCRHVDMACKAQQDNEYKLLMEAREARLNQAALTKALVSHCLAAHQGRCQKERG